MLPYTPLHCLLLKNLDLIVATSSNKKDSPIMKDEEEGIEELCDYILTHNRAIQMRADDSVVKVVESKPLFLRRARGYVPYPQKVPEELNIPDHVLALGGELKDTISVYKNGYVVTSQFLGDLDDYQNFKYFEETIEHLIRLFRVRPDAVITDLHPDFHSTRYAQKMGIPHLQIQHHFAHILAPLLEHGFSSKKKVLGVAFDGYGYGSDGTAWGSEFLIADYGEFQRFARFKPVALPGADLAAKQPWRMALAYLLDSYGNSFPEIKAFNQVSGNKVKGVLEMIKQKINSPLSSPAFIELRTLIRCRFLLSRDISS
jgi:hydrogenase maturation protein HypF